MTALAAPPARTSHRRSAHPPTVDALLPAALALADRTGTVPSLRQLIAELRVGAPKAREVARRVAEVHAARAAAGPDTPPTQPQSAPDTPALEAADGDTPDETATGQAAVPAATPRPVAVWPLAFLALPAFVAVWSGWVGLGSLTGFGVVHPLPGIADGFSINSAVTLPIGVETYAAYALRVWLSSGLPARARRFARWSALGSLALGALGQVAYHVLAAAEVTAAPWWITTVVSCLPVAVLGMGAALAHLVRAEGS